jgi:hypothetical protein
VHELAEALAGQRGKPIVLRAASFPAGVLTGGLLITDSVDFIAYPRTTPVHRDHIIGHELGHLLAGHTPTAVQGEDAVRLLAPDIDPAVIRRMLSRTNYTDREEQEAEAIAGRLSTAFAVPDVYLAVGDLTGVPNFATLLVYASITACTLTLSVWTSYMIRPIEATKELAVDERGSRWTLVSAAPILTSLVVLFFVAPVHDQPHALDFDATYATEPLVVAFLAISLTTYVTCLWRIVLLGVTYLHVVAGFM